MQGQIKIEENQAGILGYHRLKRNDYCRDHDSKLSFRCEHPDCSSPFLCNDLDCIDSHFHEERLTLTRFNLLEFRNRAEKAQDFIKNAEKTFNRAKIIKNIVDCHKRSLVTLYRELEQLKGSSAELEKTKINELLTIGQFRKIETLGKKEVDLEKQLDEFCKRLVIPVRDLHSKDITQFLQEHITGFSWQKAVQIWSTASPPEKLTELLQKRPSLLFLFLSERKVIGSFYPSTYPSLEEKTSKDSESFIFLQEERDKDSFIKFKAGESDHHVEISEKQWICQGNTASEGDGVRQFGPTLDSISYYLPSASYSREVEENDNEDYQGLFYSGKMKLRQIFVYQLMPIEQLTSSDLK